MECNGLDDMVPSLVKLRWRTKLSQTRAIPNDDGFIDRSTSSGKIIQVLPEANRRCVVGDATLLSYSVHKDCEGRREEGETQNTSKFAFVGMMAKYVIVNANTLHGFCSVSSHFSPIINCKQ